LMFFLVSLVLFLFDLMLWCYYVNSEFLEASKNVVCMSVGKEVG
jgi:hypothetical protein